MPGAGSGTPASPGRRRKEAGGAGPKQWLVPPRSALIDLAGTGAASPSFLGGGGARGWRAIPREGGGLQGTVAEQPPSPSLKQILDRTGSSSQGWEKLMRGKYLPSTGGAQLASMSGHCPPNTSPAWRVTLAPRSRPLQGLLMSSILPPRAGLHRKVRGVPKGQRRDGRPLAPWIQRGLPFAGAAHATPLGKATGLRGRLPLPCPSEPHRRITRKDPAASSALHPAEKFPIIGALWETLGSFRPEAPLE